MASIQIERFQKTLQRELANLFFEKVKDKRVGVVTIMEVRVTNDYSFATVYFTTTNDKDNVLKALESLKGFLRSELAHRVKARKMPELKFVYDESLDYGNKIDKLIAKL